MPTGPRNWDLFPARYRESIDEYIASVIESTTTSIADQDEETDSESVAYYTTSDATRLLYLVTSAFAVFVLLWHAAFLVGVDFPYLRGIRFTASHFMLMGALIFLATFSTSENRRFRYAYDAFSVLVLAILVAGSLYVFLNWETLHLRAGAPNEADVIVSTLLVLVTLEGARRVVGLPFVALGLFALLYGLFGNLVPGTLGHGGVSLTRMVTSVAVPNLGGIFGFFMELSARLITIFIFFGIFLLHLGGSRFFGDFAMKVAGRFRSGPAQVAIISSGFLGMLSGSAIANVAATGSFSIPLMKRLGYNRNFAGAVESVASTGGQITPPIMGATAFLMAAILGVPYLHVIVAAAIPAFLYYLAISLTVHIRAVKLGFEPIDTAEQVSLGSLLVRSYLFVPLLVIIYVLVEGASAEIAGWRGLQSLVVLFVAHRLVSHRDELVAGLKASGVTLVRASDSAARSMAAIMIVIAEIAWIIEIFQMTGVLQKIASTMLATSRTLAMTMPIGSELLFLSIMAAAVGIVFGFGAPSIVAYLIVALLAAPAMIQLGVVPISAHMFVFYFAILSAISPPVAGACLVSCGISNGSFLQTCKYAMRFAFPAYLLPFLWLYEPAIIAQGSLVDIATAGVSVLLAIVVLVSAFENFLLTHYTRPERALAFLAAAGLFVPLRPAKLGAAVVLGLLLVSHGVRYLDGRSTSVSVPWS